MASAIVGSETPVNCWTRGSRSISAGYDATSCGCCVEDPAPTRQKTRRGHEEVEPPLLQIQYNESSVS